MQIGCGFLVRDGSFLCPLHPLNAEIPFCWDLCKTCECCHNLWIELCTSPVKSGRPSFPNLSSIFINFFSIILHPSHWFPSSLPHRPPPSLLPFSSESMADTTKYPYSGMPNLCRDRHILSPKAKVAQLGEYIPQTGNNFKDRSQPLVGDPHEDLSAIYVQEAWVQLMYALWYFSLWESLRV